jgi:hypothetical protein
MTSLKELEGSIIKIVLPGFDRSGIQSVKLHKVEDSGLWIESQNLTNDVFSVLRQESSSRTLVVFVPWHGITVIISSIEGTSLSEKAFGLEPRG